MANKRIRKRQQSPDVSVYPEQERERSPGEATYRQQDRYQERGYYSVLPSWRNYESNVYRRPEQGPFLEEFDFTPERYEGSEKQRRSAVYERGWESRDESHGPHAGKGPKNWERSDERISEDVNERLFEDSWIDASEIEVHVEKGEVTLKGTVEGKASKRRAEDIAESVLGVSQVHNQLRVESRKK